MSFLLLCLCSPKNKQEMFFIAYTKQEMKTLNVKINWTEKVVEFKDVYTRKVDRTYNEMLFKDAKVSSSENFTMNPMSIQVATDYLIVAMTNLDNLEVDELSIKDYNEIVKIIEEIKKAPLNDTKNS